MRTVLAGLFVVSVLCAQTPSQAELQYLTSVVPLIQEHKLSEAEKKLQEGLQTFPRSAILSNALGIVLEQENRLKEAISVLENAVALLPNFTAAQLHLAALYAQTGSCDRAKGMFSSAAAGTSDGGALASAGIGLAQCKDYAAAESVLEKAHGLNPASASTTFNLALAQYENGKFEAALVTLDALPAGPEVLSLRSEARNAAAVEFVRHDQYLDAVRILSATAKLSGPELVTLGLAQFRLGRYNNASSSYTKALELDPKLDAAREGLGFLLYMTGDLERARQVVEQGLTNSGSDFYLSYLRALVLYRMSRAQWTEAQRALSQALASNSKFAPSYFLRGKILSEQGDVDAALKDFQTAARLAPNNPLPYYRIAQIYLHQGRAQEAAEARRRFSELGNLREEEVLTKQTQDLLLP